MSDDVREPSGSPRSVAKVVAALVTVAVLGGALVTVDPARRWTWKVSTRPVLLGGALRIERCAAGIGRERWVCFASVHWVTEREVDVDDDSRADVRVLGWDGRRPERCIDLRPDRRFNPLDENECCCLPIGCSDFDTARCQP